jgi:O-antigen/teichoic acid export membrane protein
LSTEETPGSLRGTVVRGASLAGGGWVVGQVMNFAFYLVLARLATPADFGELAAGTILVIAGELFAESGMLAAVIQRRDRIEEAANTALAATLAGGVLLSLLALALSPAVGLFFESDQVTEIAAVTSVWILLRSATTVPDALMQRRFSFLRRVVVEPIGIVVFGVVSIVAVSEGLGVWGLVIGNTAQRLAMAVAAWALAAWRPQPRLASFAMWRELVSFGRHVLASEVIRRVASQVNTAVLGRFVGTAALGQYQYAARIAEKPLGIVVNAGAYVLFPAFSRISHDVSRLRAAFLRAVRWISVISFPVGTIMLPLGVPFAVLLFGETWRDAGYAAMAMFAYVGGRAMVSVCSEAFKAAGRPEILPRMHTYSAVLTIAAIFALLPLGLVGVAAAVSVSAIVIGAYALWRAAEVTDMGWTALLREIWAPAVAALAMAGALFALDRLLIDSAGREVGLGLVLLVGEVLLGACLYVAFLAVVAPSRARALIEALREGPRQVGRRIRARERAAGRDVAASSVSGE